MTRVAPERSTHSLILGLVGVLVALASISLMVGPAGLRGRWALPRGPVAAREPFGALEKVADGVWALVSTPLSGDRTTPGSAGLAPPRRRRMDNGDPVTSANFRQDVKVDGAINSADVRTVRNDLGHSLP